MANDSLPLPRGLICPVITPLREDRTFDPISFERLLARIGPSADAVLVGDPLWGESRFLTEAIRLQMVRSAMEQVAGRRPLLVAVSGNSLAETERMISGAEAIAEGLAYPGPLFWVDYPLVYHSNRDLPRTYRELTRKTRVPFVLGNHPSLIGECRGDTRHRNLRTAVLKKIAPNRSVRGMIFVGSLKRSLNYQAAIRPREDFTFYDGDEATFLKRPGTGGLVAGGSNLLAEPWLRIARCSLNHYDMEREFPGHQQSIWDTGIMLHALYTLYRPLPPVYLKKILKRTGLIDSDAHRTPGPAPGPDWTAALESFLKTYDIM